MKLPFEYDSWFFKHPVKLLNCTLTDDYFIKLSRFLIHLRNVHIAFFVLHYLFVKNHTFYRNNSHRKVESPCLPCTEEYAQFPQPHIPLVVSSLIHLTAMEQTLIGEIWKMKERRDNRGNDGETREEEKKRSQLRPDAWCRVSNSSLSCETWHFIYG